MDEDEFTELAESVSGVGSSKAADLYETFAEAGAFETDESPDAPSPGATAAREILSDERRAKAQRIQMALSALPEPETTTDEEDET